MVAFTQTEIQSARVSRCIKISDGTRSLYVCHDLDNQIFIREAGHPALRYGNFFAALEDCQRELKGPGGSWEPSGHFPRCAYPVTMTRKHAYGIGTEKGNVPYRYRKTKKS